MTVLQQYAQEQPVWHGKPGERCVYEPHYCYNLMEFVFVFFCSLVHLRSLVPSRLMRSTSANQVTRCLYVHMSMFVCM